MPFGLIHRLNGDAGVLHGMRGCQCYPSLTRRVVIA